MQKILITAGATTVPIDQVRSITNIFKGQTGTNIAKYFSLKGNQVTLLTSSPELIKQKGNLKIITYKTFDQLYYKMRRLITENNFDTIIHSSAVSDYRIVGVFQRMGRDDYLTQIDKSNKIGSAHRELYLKMIPTLKIVDHIKVEWGFQGILVKFKLEVGITDEELIEIATESMKVSSADFIVANCLEWSKDYAYIIKASDRKAFKVERKELAQELYKKVMK